MNLQTDVKEDLDDKEPEWWQKKERDIYLYLAHLNEQTSVGKRKNAKVTELIGITQISPK